MLIWSVRENIYFGFSKLFHVVSSRIVPKRIR